MADIRFDDVQQIGTATYEKDGYKITATYRTDDSDKLTSISSGRVEYDSAFTGNFSVSVVGARKLVNISSADSENLPAMAQQLNAFIDQIELNLNK